MLVEAIELLVGGRADADASCVHGASEARVEGRFVDRRRREVDPRPGDPCRRTQPGVRQRPSWRRSTDLAELGSRLVDLHGQHAHQSLLAVAAQRAALDRFGAVDLDAAAAPLGPVAPRSTPRSRRSAVTRGLGPARSTCCGSRSDEIDAAAIADPDEEAELDERRRAARRRAWPIVKRRCRAIGALARRRRGRRRRGAVRASPRSPAGAVRRRRRSGCAALATELADVGCRTARARASRSRRIPSGLADVRGLAGSCCASSGASTATRWPTCSPTDDEVRSPARRARGLRGPRGRARRRPSSVRTQRMPRCGRRGGRRRPQTERRRTGRGGAGHLGALAMAAAQLDVEVGGPDPGDDVTFLLGGEPGRAGPPADEGRVGRRAGADDAGAAPRAHRGTRHAGVRRGRCRHRRRCGDRSRPGARPTSVRVTRCSSSPTCRRWRPLAARRSSSPSRRQGAARRRRARRSRARHASTRSPGCCPAAPAAQPHASMRWSCSVAAPDGGRSAMRGSRRVCHDAAEDVWCCPVMDRVTWPQACAVRVDWHRPRRWSSTTGVERDEAHLRDRRRRQLTRQGTDRVLARAPAQDARPAGHDAEARPVHQRRSRAR